MLLAIGPIAGPSSLKTSSWPMLSGAKAMIAVARRWRSPSAPPDWRPDSDVLIVRIGGVGMDDGTLLVERHAGRWLSTLTTNTVKPDTAVLPTTWPLALSDSTTDCPVAVSVSPEAPPGVDSA